MTTGYGGDHIDFRGGTFHAPVTGKVVHQHGPAPTALNSLPPRPVEFTGRTGELAALLDALRSAAPGGAPRPEAVLVAAVSGLGGIGKTALAVRAACEACEKGWFPGGTLFIDLHGYNDDPVTAGQALDAFLRALGVAPEHIPSGTDQRAALYRSCLDARAEARGPVLVVADNASSPAQVRPLLPGGTGHRLLVTSRDRLPQLGARLIPLGELPPQDAYDLLDRALTVADPGDTRAAGEPEAAKRLAALCGHLPLALQIVAALLVMDRGKPLEELAAELTRSHSLLDELDDGERSVRAAFDLSYRRLAPEQARLLRLVALAPGPGIGGEAVAAVAGTSTPPLRMLDALARAHLVERGSGRDRWRMHDLVRAFGASVVDGDAGLREEGDDARERLLAYYLRFTTDAHARLSWLPGAPEPECFADRAGALAWLDGERPGLVAAVGWGERDRFASAAVSLAERLAAYLDWRRFFDDWLVVGWAACRAADRLGSPVVEGAAWGNFGVALRQTGMVQEAIDAHHLSRELFVEAGDRERESMAWGGLGLALQAAGRVEEAIEAHTRACDLHRQAGDRRQEAMAWNNLGVTLQDAGRVEEAIEAHTRACDLYRQVGDRHLEATAWGNLGTALQSTGRLEEQIQAFARALEVFREFEDWYRSGAALYNMGGAYEAAGRPAQAHTCWLLAGDLFARAGATAEAANARGLAAAIGPDD
ncbi:ATP-binding protein [Streptomyces sp. NPDC090108]|uniref:ATP-binding protein n=1 Tax=Streptomyces sp. NPDC090108 TaxID=3365947 RepID=UPI00380B449A